METTFDDVSREATLSGGQTIYAFHKSDQCFGEFCAVHNPSDHFLKDAPLHYRPTVGSFFREFEGKTFIDPDDYNFNKYGEVIVENAIICNLCHDKVVSTHRHHMATCSCGESFADGGSAYLRRGGSDWSESSLVLRKSDTYR